MNDKLEINLFIDSGVFWCLFLEKTLTKENSLFEIMNFFFHTSDKLETGYIEVHDKNRQIPTK